MNDVDGRSGHFRQGNGAASGFSLGSRRARQRVIFRGALSVSKGLLHDDVDGAAIFRVHADQPGMLRGLAHGFEDGASSSMNTPGYAMNRLELVTPSRTSWPIFSSCAEPRSGKMQW